LGGRMSRRRRRRIVMIAVILKIFWRQKIGVS
jgi:hypothetical protein